MERTSIIVDVREWSRMTQISDLGDVVEGTESLGEGPETSNKTVNSGLGILHP